MHGTAMLCNCVCVYALVPYIYICPKIDIKRGLAFSSGTILAKLWLHHHVYF